MTDRELMQMALDALERYEDGQQVYFDEEIEALRARLAQPEPEPVFAFRRKGLDDFCTCSEDRYNELAQKPSLFEVKKFYTAPPRREWQGLTDEEVWEIPSYDQTSRMYRFARAIEATLKAKNEIPSP